MAEKTNIGDRRAFLAAGLVSIVAVSAAPNFAVAEDANPITAYNATFKAFNADEATEEAYNGAFERMNDHEPTTQRDFIRKFIAMWKDGGYPEQARIDDMLACGIRLVGEA